MYERNLSPTDFLIMEISSEKSRKQKVGTEYTKGDNSSIENGLILICIILRLNVFCYIVIVSETETDLASIISEILETKIGYIYWVFLIGAVLCKYIASLRIFIHYFSNIANRQS